MLSIPIIFYNDNKLYNINDSLYVLGIVYFLGLSFGNNIFSINDAFYLIGGIFFLGTSFSLLILIRNISLNLLIYLFLITVITDTYAYIGGSLIGRHKLTTISPKKTIEGSIVGTFMGTAIGSVYYYNMIGGVTVFQVIFLSLVLTLLSEIGDLMFSSIKRYFNKKDYSNLIPGHGGILDRFDSIIFVVLAFIIVLGII